MTGIRRYPAADFSRHLNTDHANLPTIGEVGQAITEAVGPGALASSLVVPRLTLWSHSYGDASVELDGTGYLGQDPDARFARIDNYLAASFGLSWPNLVNRSLAGASLLTGYYGNVLQNVYPRRNGAAPYLSTSGHHIVDIGINDIPIGDPAANGGQLLRAYQHVARSTISRLRAGRVFENTDPAFAYSGAWLPTDGHPRSSGGTYTTTSAVGAGFTWTIPADYTGTHVALRFRGEPGAVGCTSFTVHPSTGTDVVDSTNNFVPLTNATPTPIGAGALLIRLPLAATGTTQTVTVTANAFASGGSLSFDCAEIEDDAAGFVGWANICKPRDFYEYVLSSTAAAGGAKRTGSVGSPTDPNFKNIAGTVPLGAQPGDTWLAAYNAGMDTVIAEYGRPVFKVPLDLDIDGTLHLDQWGDMLHPNSLGNRLRAQRCYATVVAQGFTATELDVPYAARDAALGLAGRR